MTIASAPPQEPTAPSVGKLALSPLDGYFARLLDQILEANPPDRRIFITSSSEGDGKTVTATHLAQAFIARNLPVQLVELTLERARLADIFSPAPTRGGVSGVTGGLSSGDRIVCRKRSTPDSGPPITSTERLTFGEPFENMLTAAKEHYPWTIFDGPSLDSSAQTVELARGIGFTLLVVRKRSPRKLLRQAIAQLEGSLHLVLLNNR